MMTNRLLPMLAVLGAGVWYAAPARAQLFTTYGFSGSQFTWLTCGSTPEEEGCFGSGTVTGFGNICAVLEDAQHGHGSTTTQRIYVLDNQAAGKSVALDVLDETIVVSQSGYATTTFSAVKSVALPLVAGGKCQAAANSVAILAGTSKSTVASYIAKKTLVASAYGGFSPPETVTSITADASGYIAVNFTDGFYLIGPDGSGEEDGGGNQLVIPQNQALVLP